MARCFIEKKYVVEFRKKGKSFWAYATRLSDAKTLARALDDSASVTSVLIFRDKKVIFESHKESSL